MELNSNQFFTLYLPSSLTDLSIMGCIRSTPVREAVVYHLSIDAAGHKAASQFIPNSDYLRPDGGDGREL